MRGQKRQLIYRTQFNATILPLPLQEHTKRKHCYKRIQWPLLRKHRGSSEEGRRKKGTSNNNWYTFLSADNERASADVPPKNGTDENRTEFVTGVMLCEKRLSIFFGINKLS